jgi:hypothetical protein
MQNKINEVGNKFHINQPINQSTYFNAAKTAAPIWAVLTLVKG